MELLKSTVGVFLVLSVVLLTGCTTSEPVENTQEASETPSALVTGNVIAVVNGEEIASTEVTEIQQLISQQGQQVSQEDVLEQVIIQKVLEQQVEQENIVVTTEEAESLIEQQLALQGVTLAEYQQQIESQGIAYEEELENLKNQIATQKYLQDQFEGQSFEVTDQEVQAFYEAYAAQSPQEAPPFEQVESQIRVTLEQQKQQEALNAFVQDLRATAEVEYK